MRIIFPQWTKRHLVASILTLGWCISLYFWVPVEPDLAGVGMFFAAAGLVFILWSEAGAASLPHGWMESMASDRGSALDQGPIVELLGWLTLFGGAAFVLW